MFHGLFAQESSGVQMIRKLTVSLAITMLLLVVAPKAKSDSITVAVHDILIVRPIFECPSGEVFVAPHWCIGITSELLQRISIAAFGTPDSQLLVWDDSMSFVGCASTVSCSGTVYFGDSGVSGAGFMFNSYGLSYMTINSLTTTTPEPSSLLLLSAGLVGFMGLFHRKVRNSTVA